MTNKVYGTVLVNGERCPVTNLFDIDGDDTDDVEQAVRGVAKAADDKWIVFDIDATGIFLVQ
jgi:hypothetical protein